MAYTAKGYVPLGANTIEGRRQAQDVPGPPPGDGGAARLMASRLRP